MHRFSFLLTMIASTRTILRVFIVIIYHHLNEAHIPVIRRAYVTMRTFEGNSNSAVTNQNNSCDVHGPLRNAHALILSSAQPRQLCVARMQPS